MLSLIVISYSLIIHHKFCCYMFLFSSATRFRAEFLLKLYFAGTIGGNQPISIISNKKLQIKTITHKQEDELPCFLQIWNTFDFGCLAGQRVAFNRWEIPGTRIMRLQISISRNKQNKQKLVLPKNPKFSWPSCQIQILLAY